MDFEQLDFDQFIVELDCEPYDELVELNIVMFIVSLYRSL